MPTPTTINGEFPSFVETNREYYMSLKAAGTTESDTLYFLVDSGELYKGSVLFGSGEGLRIVETTADMPVDGISSTIYVKGEKAFYKFNATTNVWDKIVDLNNLLTGTVVTEIDPENPGDGPVSASAVVNYMNESGVGSDDASSVTTSSDIVIENAVGKYEAGDTIPAGTKVQDVLNNMLTNPIVYTKPALGVTFNPVLPASVEVGAPIADTNATISFTKNDGGDVTAVKVQKTVAGATSDAYNAATLPTSPVAISGLSVNDGQAVTIKTTVSYAAGAVPEKVPASALVNTKTISPFRYIFYTVDTNAGVALDNAAIIAMSKRQSAACTLNVTCVADSNRVVIAIPANRTLKSVKSSNLGYDVTSTFNMSEMQVTNSLGTAGTETAYKVYLYESEIPFPAQDIYVATIG